MERAITLHLPVMIAGVLLLITLASGLLDALLLSAGPAEIAYLPGDLQPEASREVMKASVDSGYGVRASSELVVTRHKVARGETISRIAYNYGLSPSTIISMNHLDAAVAAEIDAGTILQIPYRDGFRVTAGRGLNPESLAERYNVDLSRIQRVPDSADFFVAGLDSPDTGAEKLSGDRFHYPVSGRVITAFGSGVDNLTGIPYKSEGIDLAAEEGSPVHTAREGRVLFTGHHPSYGLYVQIAHSGGWKSFYGHLSRIDLAPGDRIDADGIVGTVGQSGTARSPRLHFALFHDGEPVDPLDYLY